MNKTEIFESFEDFTKREDKSVNGVSKKFAEENPNYIEENKSNTDCTRCTDCTDCWDCWDCWGSR